MVRSGCGRDPPRAAPGAAKAKTSESKGQTVKDNPWAEILAPYKKADDRRATVQLLNTAVPFFALWYLMAKSLEVSYVLTLLLALPTGCFLIRLFILQHDCGHGSFFTSRRANNSLGFLLGVLTLTPYQYWRRTHAIHHATAGNLDRRELGDIETMTVEEYLASSRWRRLGYRIYRNPLVLLFVGPAYQFVLKHRLPFDAPRAWRREWASVMWTNLGIAAIVVAMSLSMGLIPFLKVHLPVVLISGAIGVWLFYVQHQFEDTYWEHVPEWDLTQASLAGSSLYDLPAVVHWLTGNIGYHHIHHLSSKIPNYRLRRCMAEVPELGQVTRIRFWQSLSCLGLKLWDEEQRKLVGFSHLRTW